MDDISDPDDPRITDYRHLNDAAARAAAGRDGTDSGCTIVEGAVAVEVVVRSGLPLRSILITRRRAETLAPLLSMVADLVPVYLAEPAVLAAVVGFDLHRGVLASARRPLPLQPEDLVRRCRRVVVAAGLNDHENLGALFRNAAAFGFDAVLLDDRCADPLYRRSVRVSSGWAAVLPHARIGTLPSGYDHLRRGGLRIVALTPTSGAVTVGDAASSGRLDDPVALVVGAEGPGLTAEAIDAADLAVRVPIAGAVDSLNVATAFAVVAAFGTAATGIGHERI